MDDTKAWTARLFGRPPESTDAGTESLTDGRCLSPREGSNPRPAPNAQDTRQFVADLFGRDI